jgi:hypothetical protein
LYHSCVRRAGSARRSALLPCAAQGPRGVRSCWVRRAGSARRPPGGECAVQAWRGARIKTVRHADAARRKPKIWFALLGCERPARAGGITPGRSVEFHTVSAGTQKHRNLNLRKPKFTEIWSKSISTDQERSGDHLQFWRIWSKRTGRCCKN